LQYIIGIVYIAENENNYICIDNKGVSIKAEVSSHRIVKITEAAKDYCRM